jgi:AraC-like ligand binding domain
MVNPGEMHDGMPLGGGPREWRMLYFDPAIVTDVAEAEGVTGIEVVRPAVSDRLLASGFVALFDSLIEKAPDLLLLEENLLRVIMRTSGCHGLCPPLRREPSTPVKRPSRVSITKRHHRYG